VTTCTSASAGSLELNQQNGILYKKASIPSNALLASYKVANRIAKSKEPRAVAEELILPAAIVMANLMMIDESAGFSHLL